MYFSTGKLTRIAIHIKLIRSDYLVKLNTEGTLLGGPLNPLFLTFNNDRRKCVFPC